MVKMKYPYIPPKVVDYMNPPSHVGGGVGVIVNYVRPGHIRSHLKNKIT